MPKEKHSPVGGSVAEGLVNCPARVQRAAAMPPEPESPFAAEGTMLHNIAEAVLKLYANGRNLTLALKLFETLANKHELSLEQRKCVRVYIDHCMALIDNAGPEGKIWVEAEVAMPDLHEDFYGTADFVCYSPPFLHVVDFKAGAGVEVEIEYDGRLNRQLGYYTLGVLRLLSDEEQDRINMIECTVVQPRMPAPIKRRAVDWDELLTLSKELTKAVRLAYGPNPPAKAGKWCRFCPAKPTCPEHRADIQERAKVDFMPPEGGVIELTPEQLAELLDDAQMIEAWVTAVKNYALHMVEFEGLEIPGWKAAPKRAVRKWDMDLATPLIKHMDALGFDWNDYQPRQVLSPAQMEKLVQSKGIDPSFLKEFLAQPEPSGSRLYKVKPGQAEKDVDDDDAADWD